MEINVEQRYLRLSCLEETKKKCLRINASGVCKPASAKLRIRRGDSRLFYVGINPKIEKCLLAKMHRLISSFTVFTFMTPILAPRKK